MPTQIYRVIGRNKVSKKQHKKVMYHSKSKFNKYSPDLISRWSKNYDVEIHTYTEDTGWIKGDTLPEYSDEVCIHCNSTNTTSVSAPYFTLNESTHDIESLMTCLDCENDYVIRYNATDSVDIKDCTLFT